MEPTYKILYSPIARADIEGIGDYIANTLCATQAAEELLGKIRRAIDGLQNFPAMGKALTKKARFGMPYRWLRVENYMIFYTVDENARTVTILRVLFGASDYLSTL